MVGRSLHPINKPSLPRHLMQERIMRHILHGPLLNPLPVCLELGCAGTGDDPTYNSN